MKIKCEFCDNYMTELDENCPHCGAVNPQYKRQSDQTPRTIEELQAWYTAHNLPPKEVTRFFIGENYTGARAFGIYRDGERFIVYKNKDDGSRAIRYDGSDEAYAVNELYLKLKERIAEQKARNAGAGARKSAVSTKALAIIIACTCLGMALLILTFALCFSGPSRGYYNYNGSRYYYLSGSDGWYRYDDYSDTWTSTVVDDDLSDNYKDYYESSSYDSDYETTDFEDTSYYSDWEDRQSDWDSDSSWSGSDSWDSGGGDWSSDW